MKPTISERSFVLLVMAAGKLQNGISTEVNTILPVMIYIIPAKMHSPMVPISGLKKESAKQIPIRGPERRSHGRNRPHLLLVRSAMIPIEISVKASKNRAPPKRNARKPAGSFRISVKNGVVQVDHKVYIESCPSTPIAWPSFSFLVHCLGSSSNLASLTTSVDTKFPSLFLPQRVAGQARITLAWVPVALAFI